MTDTGKITDYDSFSRVKNKGIWGIWVIISAEDDFPFYFLHFLKQIKVPPSPCCFFSGTDFFLQDLQEACVLSDRFLPPLPWVPLTLTTHDVLRALFPWRSFAFQGFFSRKHYFLLGDSLQNPDGLQLFSLRL